jgi:NAD(P)-dependent dehydrogenase (short-subunit alcohol dehydrogenase family)
VRTAKGKLLSQSLAGRVIIVTGAGRGIGREHALLLGSEGAHVVVNDLGGGPDGTGADAGPAAAVAEEVIAAGGVAVASQADVADSDAAEGMIQLAVDTFGGVHGLVNNAGILRDRVVFNMSDDEWDISIRVNLRGTFAATRAAARYWRATNKSGGDIGRPSIVNTSSESGVFANAGQSNYAAAKAGVAALTEVWHKELGRMGVRVNGILPRARTRLTESLIGGARPDAFDSWDAGNIAPFVAYLLGADTEISGQVFLVGGGLVQRAAPWTLDPDWKLSKSGRWEIDELAKAVAEAGPPTNGDRNTGAITS